MPRHINRSKSIKARKTIKRIAVRAARSVVRSTSRRRSTSRGRQRPRIVAKRRQRRRTRRAPNQSLPGVAQGTVALQIGQGFPLESLATLPPELQWNLGCVRPGSFVFPYVEEGLCTPLKTALCKCANQEKVDSAFQAINPYKLGFYSPMLGSMVSRSGYSATSAPNEFSTIAQLSVVNAFLPVSSWSGIATGFTDKFVRFAGTLRVILRAPTVNVAGSVFLGKLTWAQLANGVSPEQLIRNATEEIDLKNGCAFELKSVVQNRYLIHENATDGFTSENNQSLNDELLAYFVILPQPFINTTTGAASEYIIDCSASENYAWWPDFRQSPMMGIPTIIPPAVTSEATQRTAALTQALESSLQTWKVPTSDAYSELVATVQNVGHKMSNFAKGAVGLVGDVAVNVAMQSLHGMISRFMPKHRGLGDGQLAIAAGPSSHSLTVELEAGVDYTDVIAWLELVAAKEQYIVPFTDFPEELYSLYDEYEVSRQTLIDALRSTLVLRRDRMKAISECTNAVKNRCGKRVIVYEKDGQPLSLPTWHNQVNALFRKQEKAQEVRAVSLSSQDSRLDLSRSTHRQGIAGNK